MKDYDGSYFKINVLLLTDVFETIRKNNLNN